MKKNSPWNVLTVTLSRNRDQGTHLRLERRPLWALAAESVGETLTELTRHVFCCDIPEWTAKVRWGPLGEDGYTSKCVFSKMFDMGLRMNAGFGAWRCEEHVADIPVTREWVLKYYPHAGSFFTDDSEDSMRCTPKDME